MPLPTKPFQEWVKEDLDQLLADPPAVETARLDFKADCKVLSSDKDEQDKARRDILKDVASMANAGGGALLIGIRQSGKQGDPPIAVKIDGIPQDAVERLRQCIDSLIATHLDVRPGPLDYWAVPYQDDKVVLVIDVPSNTYSLSMVTLGQLNQFWVRRGTDNRPMTTDEIQFRFGELAKVRDDATTELAAIRTKLTSIDYTMVWFAAVPIGRARDHVPVRVAAIRKLIAESSYFALCPDRKGGSGMATPETYSRDVVPSAKGVAYSHPNDRLVVLEIRRDGTVVFGHLLGSAPSRWQRASGPDPQGPKREYFQLWSIYEPVLSGLCLFADVQREYGVSKVAVAQAGLLKVAGRSVIGSNSVVHEDWLPVFQDDAFDLDAILLDEHWNPKDVFMQWATQLGNAMQFESAIPCPPWVGR